MKRTLLLCIALSGLLGCTQEEQAKSRDKKLPPSREEKLQELRLKDEQAESTNKDALKVSDVEVISVSLADYTVAGGNTFQQVKTVFRNNGKRPIRSVDAKISWFDSGGKLIKSVDYTIYAQFNNEPGLLPGETYTPAETEGFLLPLDQHAASAKVVITEVQERFPE